MTDRLSYLKYLDLSNDPVTVQQFHGWKIHPVTRALFKDIVIAVMDELDAPLPESFDQTIITAHQREGAMKLIDSLITWEPESVRNARTKAAAQGKTLEEVDEN